MDQKYYCAVCGKEATLFDGVIERTCEHDNEPIIAEMEAVAYGVSSMD